MEEHNPRKASLRGRGREIMRGQSEQPPSDDTPFFEDDDALLNWMHSEAESEDTPALAQPLTGQEQPRVTGNMPDEETLILPEQDEDGVDALDTIFKEPDPSFDELFGELENAQAEAAPDDWELPSFEDLTSEEALAHDMVAAAPPPPPSEDFAPDFLAEEAPDAPLFEPDDFELPEFELADISDNLPGQFPPVTEYEPGRIEVEPEEAFDGLRGDALDDLPAPRPDRRSPQQIMVTPDGVLTPSEASAGDFMPGEPAPEEAFDGLRGDALDDLPAPRPDRRSPQYPIVTPESEVTRAVLSIPAETPLGAEPEAFAMPLIEAEDSAPVDLDWMLDDEPEAVAPTIPSLSAEGEEAIPPAEQGIGAPVDLSRATLQRGKLAGLIPQEPEVFEENLLSPAEEAALETAAPVAEEAGRGYQEETPDYSDERYFLSDDELNAQAVEDTSYPATPSPEEDIQPETSAAIDAFEPETPAAVPPIPASDPMVYQAEDPLDDFPEGALDLTGLDFDSPSGAAPAAPQGEIRRSADDGLLSDAVEEAVNRSYFTGGPIEADDEVFAAREARRPAKELFIPDSETPDEELLRLFIDDARLRELYEQIEALQEEIVLSVRGERGQFDTYQEELLAASNLLLRSRQNYDEARAIVYRVRADLNRERRVAEDINRYRPQVLLVYSVMMIAIFTGFGLGQAFVSLGEDVGASWLGQGIYPGLGGALGALLFAFWTLLRHTNRQRDFDPVHLSWYYSYPIIGFISGFLVFLFMLLTVETSGTASSETVMGANPFYIVTAAAVGARQDVLLNLLDSARQRVAPDNSPTRADSIERRPPGMG